MSESDLLKKKLHLQKIEADLLQSRLDMSKILAKHEAAINALQQVNKELEDCKFDLQDTNKALKNLNDQTISELVIANNKLVFQNEEKEKRADELAIANTELIFQNHEKEQRAAELVIANDELIFESHEKEKRAAELIMANLELIFHNEEKTKLAAELLVINNELESFTYVSSHDLQEPLRKIQTFASLILEKEHENLSPKGKDYFDRIRNAAKRMTTLLEDLLTYSHTNISDRKFNNIDLDLLLQEVTTDLAEMIRDKNASIQSTNLGSAYINESQFRQVLVNLISNAIKFTRIDTAPSITITSRNSSNATLQLDNTNLPDNALLPEFNYYHLSVTDNGIGFDPSYRHRIFDVFQRLHSKEDFTGTGIGLAIVKKIVTNHNGFITASGKLNEGATFDIYMPHPKNVVL